METCWRKSQQDLGQKESKLAKAPGMSLGSQIVTMSVIIVVYNRIPESAGCPTVERQQGEWAFCKGFS